MRYQYNRKFKGVAVKSFSVMLFLLLSMITAEKEEPNHTVKTIYFENSSGEIQELKSKTYTDGSGRAVQSQSTLKDYSTSDGEEYKNIVSGVIYDNFGRKLKTVMAYPSVDDRYIDNTDMIEDATEFYSGRYPDEITDNPYSEFSYFDNPNSEVKEVASPGDAYKMNTTRTTKGWSFGIPDIEDVASWYGDITLNGERVFDENGFMRSYWFNEHKTNYSGTEEEYIEHIYYDIRSAIKDYLEPRRENAYYVIDISMSVEGNVSQSISNMNGEVLRKIADPDVTVSGDEIISEYEYDIIGNKIKEIPPEVTGRPVDPTTYTYNGLGQMVSMESPDGGVVEYEFNKTTGDLKYTTKESYLDSSIYYEYDRFGREKAAYKIDNYYKESEDKKGRLLYKKYYDKVPELKRKTPVSEFYKTHEPPENLKGRVALTVFYDASGYNKVFELFSYNDEGQVKTNYKLVPSLPIQKYEFEYNRQGGIVKTVFSDGNKTIIGLTEYDINQRVKRVTYTDPEIDYDDPETDVEPASIEYTYNELGQLKEKSFTGDVSLIRYEYNLMGNLKKIQEGTDESGSEFYEKIYYQDGLSAEWIDNTNSDYQSLYNGMITAAEYNYNDPVSGAGRRSYRKIYQYDKTNRLTGVKSLGEDQGSNSSYRYLADGRFEMKQEKDGSRNYTYWENTNRVKCADPDNTDPDKVVYLYDRSGNMVIDLNKRMVIKYDWRNLPECFYFYLKIPVGSDDITYNSEGEYVIRDQEFLDFIRFEYPEEVSYHGIDEINKGANTLIRYMRWKSEQDPGIELISSVYMIYDASGNRVCKLERR